MSLVIYIRLVENPDTIIEYPSMIICKEPATYDVIGELFGGTIMQIKPRFYSYLSNILTYEESIDDRYVCDIMSIFIWLLNVSTSDSDYVSSY